MPATVFVGNQARIRGVVPRLLDATTPDGSIYSADKSSPRGTTSISTPDAQIGLRARNWRQKGSIVTMLSTARVERPTAGSGTSANRWRGTNDSFPPTAADFPHDKGWTAVDPGCAKIRATERAASTRGWQVGPDDLVVIAFLGHGAETPPRSRVRSSGNCMAASQQVAY